MPSRDQRSDYARRCGLPAAPARGFPETWTRTAMSGSPTFSCCWRAGVDHRVVRPPDLPGRGPDASSEMVRRQVAVAGQTRGRAPAGGAAEHSQRDPGEVCDVNLSPLPKRLDRASRPPSWGRTRPVTIDSGQKQATGTWVSGRGVTLVLGKLGGEAGRRSNGKCRFRGGVS